MMKEMRWQGLSLLTHTPQGEVPPFLRPAATEAPWAFHHTLPDYAPTPLVRLPGLARALGVREVLVKDESRRFGLNAFKGLGGIYALARAAGEALGLAGPLTWERLQTPAVRQALAGVEFVTATDGNHGRGVAWAARRLGCRAHVYLPAGSVPARAQAILDAGAVEAEILPLSYDGTVAHAARLAQEKGWRLIQDTSWPGYEEVPAWIVQGYTTMAREAAEQLEELGLARPTHVFLQAGVGAMAGGVLGYLAARYGEAAPDFLIAEPEDIPCIYASAQAGQPRRVEGQAGTIMAGLNCGTPCSLTWPVLRDLARWYAACPDAVAEEGMRLLGRPHPGDPAVVSGESGAVTAGLLARLAQSPLRQDLGLGEDSVVLLFSTEGDTDPEHYRQVLRN
ncbi:MAG TPA: diaminopropionate ammonia-lyase [Candidatus Evtepia faecavium]|nr:diaminopropionate ammonia-lyase [Candidatus Evtepia faecavium]